MLDVREFVGETLLQYSVSGVCEGGAGEDVHGVDDIVHFLTHEALDVAVPIGEPSTSMPCTEWGTVMSRSRNAAAHRSPVVASGTGPGRLAPQS